MSRDDQKNAVTRRDALTTIGIAGAAAAIVGAGAAEVAQHANGLPSHDAHGGVVPNVDPPVALDPHTQALFAPLMASGRVGEYQLVAVHAIKLGAIPVVLATAEGTRFQIDVLRHDASVGGVNGVRSRGSFTVALHNEGAGADPTSEQAGLGAMALLDALAEREAEGASVPALATLRERTSRFPRAVFAVS
jgi:hypothetical protein